MNALNKLAAKKHLTDVLTEKVAGGMVHVPSNTAAAGKGLSRLAKGGLATAGLGLAGYGAYKMLKGKDKTAEEKPHVSTAARGAGWGGLIAGPLGAGIGAAIGRKRGQKKGEHYHGSPGWRAFGGALAGSAPLSLIGRKLIQKGHVGTGLGVGSIGATLAAILGGRLGAQSAYSGKGK